MSYRIAVALLGIALAAGVTHAKDVYRWKADDGSVHYGENPPQGVEADKVRVSTGEPAAGSNKDARKKGPAKAEGGSEESARAEQDAAESSGTVDTEFVREQCKRAKQNMKALTEGGSSGRYINDEGQAVRYSEEQYKARVEKNERFVERFCGNKEASG